MMYHPPPDQSGYGPPPWFDEAVMCGPPVSPGFQQADQTMQALSSVRALIDEGHMQCVYNLAQWAHVTLESNGVFCPSQ